MDCLISVLVGSVAPMAAHLRSKFLEGWVITLPVIRDFARCTVTLVLLVGVEVVALPDTARRERDVSE